MTKIYMYIDIADRRNFLLGFLVKKILPRQQRVLVAVADDQEAQELDDYLWTANPNNFVPHVRLEDEEAAADTPIIITADAPPDNFCANTLISWCDEAPPFFARFDVLIDLVSTPAKNAGRARYRFYRERGYEIITHSLAQK